MSGHSSLLARWPVLDRHPHARSWLQAWSDLGRTPRTVDAYARGLAEYLEVCELRSADPVLSDRAAVAGYVRHLFGRPSHRGINVVAIDSGAELANATIQQRLVPVRGLSDPGP